MAGEGGAGNGGVTSGGGSDKKPHPKGATHALHYDILDDPNIKAESNWEKEEAEYWTSRMCRKYIKMYHIDKLWPREFHARHTHDYACKPYDCKNEHFVHRSKEVWRALFGDKPMVKGYINYSVACMVYAELILARKVDWSTFPTTVKVPLLLMDKQKDIPDLYNRKAEPSEPSNRETVLKNTTMPTTKVSEVASAGVQLGSTQKATKVSNASLGGVEGEVFLTPPTDLLCTPKVTTLVEQSMAPGKDNISQERETPSTARASGKEVDLEEVAKACATIDHIIESDALNILTHVPFNLDSTTVSSPILSPNIEVHQSQSNGEPLNDMAIRSTSKGEDIESKHPHLSSLNTSPLKVVRQAPTHKDLESILKCCKRWKAVQEEQRESVPVNEAGSSNPPQQGTHWRHFSQIAYSLVSVAEYVAELSPRFMEMANHLAIMSPELLSNADNFFKFSDIMEPFLDEKLENMQHLVGLAKENEKLQANCDELAQKLQKLEDVERRLALADKMDGLIANNHELLLKVQTLETMQQKAKGTILSQDRIIHQLKNELASVQGTQESDKLSLPFEKEKAVDEAEDNNDKAMVVLTTVRNAASTFHDASTQTEGSEVEELKKQLDEANQRNVRTQSEFERLQSIVQLDECMSNDKLDPRWLTWVHQLQAPRRVVTKSMKGLLKLAMKSDEEFKAIHNSYWQMKQKFESYLGGSTYITQWGDMDLMFERLNNAHKEESTHINWVLEAEEGWIPYNTLSAHIKKDEKMVVHACDPSPGILQGRCSLCQGHFGPEGALTMGQCRHTFHITCIVKASLIRSACPECRSPLSPRFYEMFGLMHNMPPGHEYNRWTLPLDQGPYKFQNYKHWGRPLTWNAAIKSHGLYEESGEHVDSLMWMTSNREVALKAFCVPRGKTRELFCRSMGGHWSEQHGKFFRFPEKQVQKGPDGNWIEVEHAEEFNEQYKTYDDTLTGRALFLSKLEEAAQVRDVMETDGHSATGHALVEVAKAFDKRVDDIITQWREFLLGGDQKKWFHMKDEDKVVNTMVEKVDAALRTLKAQEVDLSPKRRQKKKMEDEDDYSPETKRQFTIVDMEARAAGSTAERSPGPRTRLARAKFMAKAGSSHNSEEDGGNQM